MPLKDIDYSKTIIYKIVCKDINIKDCYVGSTTDFIRRRSEHKKNVVNNTQSSHLYVYEFIKQNNGWDNWEMIEVEKYNAVDKNDSLKRERYWLEELKATLNKQIPARTLKEWREDNKEKAKEYSKEYRENNKEYYKEYAKEYRENNKDQLIEQKKEYYEDNKDKINEQRKEYRKHNKDKISEQKKEKITCECGSIVRKNDIARHNKTKKHLDFLKIKK
jgi:hypothetical protein